jgi:anti-sigma factor RsiW
VKPKQFDEELSAYLDGESDEPEAVARLLQKDADAARRYMELSKLSAHLKALRPPEVHPSFATRVVALARESATPQRRPRLAWLYGLAVAALFAVIVAPLVLRRESAVPTLDPRVAQVLELREQSGETIESLASVLDERMPEDWDAVVDDSLDLASESADDYTTLLASVAFLRDDPGQFEYEGSVDIEMGLLTDSELNTLKSLLDQYAEQGTEIL